MTIKLFAFTCGTVTGEFAHLMEGGEGGITVPIPVFLIEHPEGRGAVRHRACTPIASTIRPAGSATRLAGLFEFDYAPGEDIGARLEAIGRDPGEDRPADQFAFPFRPCRRQRADPQRDDAGAAPRMGRRHGPRQRRAARLQPARFRPWPQIAPASMASTMCSATARWCACRPTGTRRATSRCGCGSTAATSCWRRIPAISAKPCASGGCRALSHDREAMLASLDRLEALERGGARIFFGHDPEFWHTRAASPRRRRMKLPTAILFDLDDTILAAFGQAAAVAAHRRRLRRPARAASASAVCRRDPGLFAPSLGRPGRHKYWRHRIGEARRHIVENALAHWRRRRAQPRRRELCHAVADGYSRSTTRSCACSRARTRRSTG